MRFAKGVVMPDWIDWFAMCAVWLVFIVLDTVRELAFDRRSNALDAYSRALDARGDALDSRSEALDLRSASPIAHVWDGVGPERDCLLRFKWEDGSSEWLHVQWQELDGDDAEDGNPHPDRYYQDLAGYSMPKGEDGSYAPESGFSFVVTHWSELPEVEP